MHVLRALNHQMFHISVQDFKEHVRLSHSWSEVARRCGKRFYRQSIGTVLKQKVILLKLDTQHFTSMQWMKTATARRVWITERVGEVGKGGVSDQMYQISPEEFTELVRLSHRWEELGRRCGARAKLSDGFCGTIVKVLKQKVLFLKLDTQHFTVPAAVEADVQVASEASKTSEAGAAGKCDELTCRLISLHNTVIDEGNLKLLHGCARGHTLEEFEAYVKLWRHVVDEREEYMCKYPTTGLDI